MTLKYKFVLLVLFSGLLFSCTDDLDYLDPDQSNGRNLSDVPSEYTDGYSLCFNFGIAPMDEGNMSLSRSTNQELRSIEQFVDLEKLRILYFTCLDDTDYVDEYADPWKETSTGQRYHSGKHDVFLFEAKSRWVSLLSTSQASDAEYMVTSPVFPLEETENDYNWDYIREALIKRPFKIVILVNRPEAIRYSDFDKNYGQDTFSFGNKGPYWGPEESEKGREDYIFAEKVGFKNLDTAKLSNGDGFPGKGTNINELHHCQWDPVYANKNKDDKYHFYDFIIENPVYTIDQSDNDEKTWIAHNKPNAMGTVSAWTTWMKDGEGEDADWIRNPDDRFDKNNYPDNFNDPDLKFNYKPYNFYLLPDQKQGIPMYGVQQFDALGEWEKGTPIALSGNGKKHVHVLRSLARIELKIPKSIATDVQDVALMYSNVFGRCEPLDVATPTDELWKSHSTDCEWNNIYKYGPIINTENLGANEVDFLNQMAWFYGAWKPWWHFNSKLSKDDARFETQANIRTGAKMPYPHIFNPCIQRNGTAKLDFVQTTDDKDDYFHYVVYTGERNINDPSKFTSLVLNGAEIAYFSFRMKPKNSNSYFQYCIAINPYNEGTVLRNTYTTSGVKDLKDYKKNVNFGTQPKEWNWPIMRNHAYSFTVRSTSSSNKDTEGIDVIVIDSENRQAPDIVYW